MKLTLGRLGAGYQRASVLGRAIVAKRVPTLAGLGIILGELVRDGIIPDGLANGVTHWATVGFTAAGVIGGVLWAHQGTTPADPQLLPKDKYGNPLVSVRPTGPHGGLPAPVSICEPSTGEPSAGEQQPSAAAALAVAAAISPAGLRSSNADPPAEAPTAPS